MPHKRFVIELQLAKYSVFNIPFVTDGLIEVDISQAA